MLTEAQRYLYVNEAFKGEHDLERYIQWLVEAKRGDESLSWQDIADLVDSTYGIHHSRHWYSRNYSDLLLASPTDNVSTKDSFSEKLLELQKEKVKISDERNQTRAYVRRLAREDTIKEIAIEAAKLIAQRKPFLETISSRSVSTSRLNKKSNKEALALLSDWHYGFDFEMPWNKYNPEICRERVARLLNETVSYCSEKGIKRIHVLNLSDLIAGRIHLTIRLESRTDVITQIMEVSEILAEFLQELSVKFDVDYYSCDDNHSRLEPDKTQSLDLESLSRITDWYLRTRLGNNVSFHDNKFGNDIITMNVLGHNIAGVHGHHDKPQKTIEDISLMTRANYDLICMAHLHHFSMDEKCGCRIVLTGSLMGTDNFAKNLRLHSKPSQTIIVVSEDRVCEDIHIVELD